MYRATTMKMADERAFRITLTQASNPSEAGQRGRRPRRPLGLALSALFALALLFGGRPAQAGGTFKLKSTAVTEVSGAWHVFVTLELSRPPATAHVPLKFLFTKETVFERALVDGHDQPVLNRQPLVNQTPSVESLDVDFADGSGKIFKGTRFDFGLTRTRGYEAGEYKVQVRTTDGVDVGATQHLTLNGDNPVVDRRAMTFNAKEKSIKKVDNGLDGGTTNGPPKADDDVAPVQTQDVAPSGSAAPFIPASAYDKTPEEQMKENPKGCGCEVVGSRGASTSSVTSLGLLGFGGLALVWQRRRARKEPRARA